jgi:hypothetical protein
MGIIYRLENIVTKKSYIGQTTKLNINARLNNHKSENSRCLLIKRSISKHGIENFDITILEKNIPENQLDDLEKKYIKTLNTLTPFGYNIENGGNKNKKLSKETKRKISESEKGKKLSEETKQKISLANKGRKLSEETKRKMSEDRIKRRVKPPSPLGRHPNKETKKKISLANKGRKVSKETKKKLSESHKGQIAWNKGLKYNHKIKDKSGKCIVKPQEDIK